MSTKRFCFVLIVRRRNEKREVLCERVKSRVKCSLWTHSPPPPFLLLFKNLGCIQKGSRHAAFSVNWSEIPAEKRKALHHA